MNKYVPTTKWLVATGVGAVGLAVMLLTGDRAHVTDPEIIAVGTFLVQRLAAWGVPNSDADAGRQLAHKQPRRTARHRS